MYPTCGTTGGINGKPEFELSVSSPLKPDIVFEVGRAYGLLHLLQNIVSFMEILPSVTSLVGVVHLGS